MKEDTVFKNILKIEEKNLFKCHEYIVILKDHFPLIIAYFLKGHNYSKNIEDP